MSKRKGKLPAGLFAGVTGLNPLWVERSEGREKGLPVKLLLVFSDVLEWGGGTGLAVMGEGDLLEETAIDDKVTKKGKKIVCRE